MVGAGVTEATTGVGTSGGRREGSSVCTGTGLRAGDVAPTRVMLRLLTGDGSGVSALSLRGMSTRLPLRVASPASDGSVGG